MSVAETLIKAGAHCVGGDLILNNQSLGQFRDGDFHISAEGLMVFEDLQKKHSDSIVQAARDALAEDLDLGDVDLEPPRRGRKAK